MPYAIPSWLRPADDPAHAIVAGFQAGAAVANQRAHLAQQAENLQAEINLKQQMADREAQREQAHLEFTKAYHDQQNAIAQGQLQKAQEEIAVKTQAAAQKFQAQQMMQTRRQELMAMPGMDATKASLQAALEFPHAFSSPAGLSSAAKELYAETHPFEAKRINVGGVDAIQTGPNRLQVIKKPTPVKDPTEFETVTTTIPEKPAIEATEGTEPGLLGRLIGKKGTPGTPAQPGTLKITTSRKVRIGAASTATNLPKTGEIWNGHRFKGGDPSNPDNWEVVDEE